MNESRAHSVKPGPSIIELIWERLDETYADLVEVLAGKESELSADYLRGLCFAHAEDLAIITNPYNPDVNAIRAETVERHA